MSLKGYVAVVTGGASGNASYITGQAISITGGAVMR